MWIERFSPYIFSTTQHSFRSKYPTMESLAYISLSLARRLFFSVLLPVDIRARNVVVGLIEGAFLQHTFNKAKRSPLRQFTTYARFLFCLLTDYAFTRCETTLAVVMLSAGVGMLLYEVVHTLQRRPLCQCDRCQLKTKIALSMVPRRPVPSSKARSKVPAPVAHLDMSVHDPKVRFLGAALLPDRIDEDLERIPSHTPSEQESSIPPAPSPAHEPCHLATMTSYSEPQMPHSASSSIGDKFDNLCLQESSIISEAPYVYDLQHTPTPRTISPSNTLPVALLSDDAFQLIKEHDVQQTSSIHEDAIPPIPSSFPFSRTSNKSNDNNQAAGVSTNASSDEWDDFISEASPPSSVLSVNNREDLLSHAELMRHLAVEADQMSVRLEADRKLALEGGRIKEAFLLRDQIQDAVIMSKRLHERAERRYYCGACLLYLLVLTRLISVLWGSP
jgi:hypothetical protein